MLMVSSGLAFVPIAITPTYCATKAAIHSDSQSLRWQLRDRNVEVLELTPPYVQTELMGPDQTPPPPPSPPPPRRPNRKEGRGNRGAARSGASTPTFSLEEIQIIVGRYGATLLAAVWDEVSASSH